MSLRGHPRISYVRWETCACLYSSLEKIKAKIYLKNKKSLPLHVYYKYKYNYKYRAETT